VDHAKDFGSVGKRYVADEVVSKSGDRPDAKSVKQRVAGGVSCAGAGEVGEAIEGGLCGYVEAQGGIDAVQCDVVCDFVEVGFGAIVDDEAGR
jgi:hypothetical protein